MSINLYISTIYEPTPKPHIHNPNQSFLWLLWVILGIFVYLMHIYVANVYGMWYNMSIWGIRTASILLRFLQKIML